MKEKSEKKEKPSKSNSEVKEEVKEISLEYKLLDLPSSQHKAGLAGLYMMIDWLDKQDINKDLIKRTEITETGLKVILTKRDLKDLFDEIYKPILIDIVSKSEPKGLEYTTFERREKTTFYYYEVELKKPKKELKPIREIVREILDNKTGKVKKINSYIYEEKLQEKKEVDDEEIEPIREEEIEDIVTFYTYKKDYPLGSFIYALDSSTDKVWVKIWREMQWLLRGFKQQEPFKSRIDNKDFCKDANDFWDVLIKENQMNDLSKVLFLSAQNNNAENVNFKEITKNKLLLHFWMFVAQPYAYWTQRKDKNKYKTDEHGFIIAIPDIANLNSFIIIFKDLIQNLENKIRNYPIKRPEQAVVYLPGLAGLLLLKNIHDIMRKKINFNYSEVVYGVDLFHYDYEWKAGKAKKNRASIYKGYTRIKPNTILEDRATGIKKLYRNFFFQKQLLQNIFDEKDDMYNFYNLFSSREYEYFFNHWEGEFKPDAVMYFDQLKIIGEQLKMLEENEKQKTPKSLELLIYSIIQSYVYGKLKSKHQLEWDNSMKGNERGKDYSDKKEKIAKDAFLAIRSRKDKDDFITYFTSTICSVSQRLGEDGFKVLVDALYNSTEEVGWEKVRALSMLALSANS